MAPTSPDFPDDGLLEAENKMGHQIKAQLPGLTEVAKRELRSIMKKRLEALTGEAIQEQSRYRLSFSTGVLLLLTNNE